MISKKILIPVIALVITGGTVFVASGVNAQTPADRLSELSEVIAQKFGLDKSKVQTVVDEFHTSKMKERHAEMQKKWEDKLTQDVKDGKITETQKQAILKKLAELKSANNPDTMKNMTAEERKKTMETKRAELKSWAESQGIDPSYVIFGFGRGGLHKQGWSKP
jgi:phenylpyruvate tautomerase PptA (4-oxalocrotonate tautomerase family)